MSWTVLLTAGKAALGWVLGRSSTVYLVAGGAAAALAGWVYVSSLRQQIDRLDRDRAVLQLVADQANERANANAAAAAEIALSAERAGAAIGARLAAAEATGRQLEAINRRIRDAKPSECPVSPRWRAALGELRGAGGGGAGADRPAPGAGGAPRVPPSPAPARR